MTFYFATSKACCVYTSHTILIWNPLHEDDEEELLHFFFSMIFVVFFYFQCFMRTRSNIWKCDYEIVLFFKAQGYRRRLEPKIYLNFIQTTTQGLLELLLLKQFGAMAVEEDRFGRPPCNGSLDFQIFFSRAIYF